jgi:hypothetical protein
MYPIESTDHRSQEILNRLCDKIDLTDNIIFTNEIIEIPYRINAKSKAIILNTPLDIAAFAHHNYLICRYKKNGKGITMYRKQLLDKFDRRGYPFQYLEEVIVKKIPTMFSRSEIKMFVARYEYDFGDIADQWPDLFAAKGIVREMFPTGTSNNDTKRIA